MQDLFSNPLMLLVLGYFLARWDKRGDHAAGESISLARLQSAVEEQFKTVFNRLDHLDASKEGHDRKIGDLVTQVGNLCTRLDLLLGIGRSEAMRRQSRSAA